MSRKLFRRIFALTLFAALLAPAGVSAYAQNSQPERAGEQSTPLANSAEKRSEVKDENEAYRHSPTVVKLGSMLGMTPEQSGTVFTLFNLIVLLVAVGYGLLKFLPKTFRKRSSDIQKHLVDARTATEEATARLNSVEERLSKLDDQIAAMRTQSEADSARDEKRIRENIEAEKAKILAAAEQEIATATTQAQRSIQQYAAELAIEQAARKLVVNAETDRLLVESFAHRLGGDKGGQN